METGDNNIELGGVIKATLTNKCLTSSEKNKFVRMF